MSWKEYQKTGAIGTENKKTLTLLIVDDERGILNTLEESFRDMFKVHTANSGAEALQIFRDKEIHLVLSDQRMPEMTGVELFGKLKAINPTPSASSSPVTPTSTWLSAASTRASCGSTSPSPGTPRS
jgi:DNA-binding NtrC family response regulator